MNDEREDRLTAAASKLRTEIAPGRDLWPQIEAAIADSQRRPESQPRRSPWTTTFARAAAIVLLIGASSSLTWLLVKDGDPIVQQPIAPDYVFERAAFGSNYSLGADYLETRADLMKRLQQELGQLSPEDREDVETSLDVIRGAIDDINAALEQDPDNVLLQDLLMKTYHEELNVMRKVGGMRQSAMLRSDI